MGSLHCRPSTASQILVIVGTTGVMSLSSGVLVFVKCFWCRNRARIVLFKEKSIHHFTKSSSAVYHCSNLHQKILVPFQDELENEYIFNKNETLLSMFYFSLRLTKKKRALSTSLNT